MTDRLSLYDTVAQRAADVMVRGYSTSFGLATRLLPPLDRVHVRNVYALVRLADEVVDGAAQEAGGDPGTAGRQLDRLEAETYEAMSTGYSTNVLVHAFATTARWAGIGTDLVEPFFASMRTDLDRTEHDEASLARYIHGSAEVVGLMCLRIFLMGEPGPGRATRYAQLAPGAEALGAAFQKINFLRDLAEDHEALGRSYFVGVDPRRLTEAQKAAIIADVDDDLAVAAGAVRDLPPSARRAVRVAYALFAELSRRLAATPAQEVLRSRVRVPGPVKARLAVAAMMPNRSGPGGL